jgi:hypothetical protein
MQEQEQVQPKRRTRRRIPEDQKLAAVTFCTAVPLHIAERIKTEAVHPRTVSSVIRDVLTQAFGEVEQRIA